MNKYRSVMFVGTGSDVGKSIINAGFCRIFKQDGMNPAPYKAQNMSLNSYATPDGLEIGRAQAVQAEAAGVPCATEMNPVLLKPTSDKSSQVVLHGKPFGNQSAWDYFMDNNKQNLFEEVKGAYDKLAQKYSPIVMEGAGSISELNLKKRDITNMRIAQHANAATFLIADIDKGGVFGSVYGTIKLLEEDEQRLIKGIIINKFRGDIKLFEDGRKIMEEITGVPVVGVVPYFRDIQIEEEDSVVVDRKIREAVSGKVNVAVVLLRRMSNFTDFNALEKDDRVNLFYTNNPSEIEKADIVIIPGSKNTIEDLIDLKNNGAGKAIYDARKNGKTVIGICGGYQMLGISIEDPLHTESNYSFMTGLGLLPVKTTLEEEKVTEQQTFQFKGISEKCSGYEIHMGTSELENSAEPLATLADGRKDGCWVDEKCWGTYLHGVLDNDEIINQLIAPYVKGELKARKVDYQTFKEEQYDKLADMLRGCMDMDYIYKVLRNEA
ncbi:cobyric acid synthase [Flammeovirgaceae bacterium SG7u.111]|nr:cobyric acid synthase [Flammeovirgaceae bacterium SG7u.132]WPO36445.1 cobyric acid synthase [Flammeovirgaceae bacterium SG7u.111]